MKKLKKISWVLVLYIGLFWSLSTLSQAEDPSNNPSLPEQISQAKQEARELLTEHDSLVKNQIILRQVLDRLSNLQPSSSEARSSTEINEDASHLENQYRELNENNQVLKNKLNTLVKKQDLLQIKLNDLRVQEKALLTFSSLNTDGSQYKLFSLEGKKSGYWLPQYLLRKRPIKLQAELNGISEHPSSRVDEEAFLKSLVEELNLSQKKEEELKAQLASPVSDDLPFSPAELKDDIAKMRAELAICHQQKLAQLKSINEIQEHNVSLFRLGQVQYSKKVKKKEALTRKVGDLDNTAKTINVSISSLSVQQNKKRRLINELMELDQTYQKLKTQIENLNQQIVQMNDNPSNYGKDLMGH